MVIWPTPSPSTVHVVYGWPPSQYACRRSPVIKPLGGNPGLHLLLKNHKLLTSQSSGSEYDQVFLET